MRTFIIALAALAALGGCTVKNTTVRQARTPPPVVTAPAPTVVYPAPVVQAPTIVAGPTARTVTVSYAGAGGFQLAARQADAYCDQQFGSSNAEPISDNAALGRAVFACD